MRITQIMNDDETKEQIFSALMFKFLNIHLNA